MMRHFKNLRAVAVAGLLAAALMTLPAVSAHAGSVLDTPYGSPAATLGAEADAMAGTGVAVYRGGISARLNPALLTSEKSRRVDGSLCLYQDHEDRFQSLWDSFESYVADTAIASQRSHYFDTGFGAALRAGRGLVVGAALSTLYDWTYDFDEEILDPDPGADVYDTILEQRSFTSDGRLRALTLGVAMSTPDERLSVGVSGNYAFGTRELTRSRRFAQDQDDSYTITEEFDYSGFNAVLGLYAKLTPRLELGAAWETPLTVSGDQDYVATVRNVAADTLETVASARDGEVKYPNRYRIGFTLYPRSEPRTVFTAEMIFSEWTMLEDDLYADDAQPRLEDTVDVRVGVQHTFYNGVPLRFGFRRLDSYTDPEAGASFFTTGIGIPWEKGMFQISAELSKVESYQEHWFPYEYEDTDIVTADYARVEETRFRLGAGFTYLF